MTTKTLVVHYKSDDIMVSEDVAGGKKKGPRNFTIEALHKDGGSVIIPVSEAGKIGAALASLGKE